MADKSGIEWTEATWNPIVGCDIVSPGCTNCYAMGMAGRIESMATGSGKETHYAGTTQRVKGKQEASSAEGARGKAKSVWTGKLALAPEKTLIQPLAWKKPRTIFVNSMSDLFHESVPDEWIDRVFAVMANAPQHTFQVLTKRAKRMRDYFQTGNMREHRITVAQISFPGPTPGRWPHLPLPNVWLGVSAEDQRRADERIPDLLATPAAIRFVSAEPLLGPIEFDNIEAEPGHSINALFCEEGPEDCATDRYGTNVLDWVIVGGESGQSARPIHPGWARSIRDQCADAGVPFFFKQWGRWSPDRPVGGTWSDFQPSIEPPMFPVGKKAAGRLLDGVEHNGMPQPREVPAL